MVTKIEVCEFARRINIGVKAQMGIRQLSNRALGKLIGRSERYIRDRVKDEQEWRIGDLQLMCKLWDMTFGQLTSYVDLADPQKITGESPDQIDPDSVTIRQFVAIMDGDKVVQVLNGMPSLTSSDYEDTVSDAVPQGRHMAKSKPLTDEDRKRIVLEKLRRGDMSLAAHKDPYKREEMNGGDGR